MHKAVKAKNCHLKTDIIVQCVLEGDIIKQAWIIYNELLR